MSIERNKNPLVDVCQSESPDNLSTSKVIQNLSTGVYVVAFGPCASGLDFQEIITTEDKEKALHFSGAHAFVLLEVDLMILLAYGGNEAWQIVDGVAA